MSPSTSNNSDNSEEDMLVTLLGNERWWRERYEMLLRHGYQLRPRFRPGWTPSSAGTKKSPLLCEDGHTDKHVETMDAKRLSDSRRVKMKKLIKSSKELEIAHFLSSKELARDPRNHCAPVLDVISEDDSWMEYMVMPLLVPCMEPPFSFVDEVLDFMKQVLEGLVFMHEHGVAHRDCSARNIMLDGERLFPKGFHPNLPSADARGIPARPRRRRNVHGVKYYFIDFGISTLFNAGEKTRLVTGIDGLDQDVPELHESQPYDPFPVDIFILGNLFRKEITQVYENMVFLKPLVARMTERNSNERPTAQQALNLFIELVEKQPRRSLRWVLMYFDMAKFERFVWTSEAVVYEASFLVKSIGRKFFRSLPGKKKRLDSLW